MDSVPVNIRSSRSEEEKRLIKNYYKDLSINKQLFARLKLKNPPPLRSFSEFAERAYRTSGYILSKKVIASIEREIESGSISHSPILNETTCLSEESSLLPEDGYLSRPERTGVQPSDVLQHNLPVFDSCSSLSTPFVLPVRHSRSTPSGTSHSCLHNPPSEKDHPNVSVSSLHVCPRVAGTDREEFRDNGTSASIDEHLEDEYQDNTSAVGSVAHPAPASAHSYVAHATQALRDGEVELPTLSRVVDSWTLSVYKSLNCSSHSCTPFTSSQFELVLSYSYNAVQEICRMPFDRGRPLVMALRSW